MRLKIFLIFIGFLFISNLFAQQEHSIYKIEKELMLGNKKALLDIAGYFDSTIPLTVFLGYHIINTTESNVAKRIVIENCNFLETEILISDKTTAIEFQTFLNQNLNQIFFSEYANAFLLTPLEKRKVTVDIREISTIRKRELEKKSNSLLNLKWAKSNNIAVLIKDRAPKALLLIASELYKERGRFNKSFSNKSDYIDLIRLITGTDIATDNEKNQRTWFIEEEYYPNASFNLLIYFSKNYKNYTWNKKKSIFENKNALVNPLNKEELLFELLNDKDDSIAKNAFRQLTKCKIENVITIANQYEKSSIEANYTLPTFPYRFLKQLVVLTDYAKKNDIDLENSEELKKNIKLLENKLSFSERRKLENKVIESLTLDQITSFEYYALLNEKSWELTYSAGRILDVFYSRNWNDLLNDKKHLKLYLKKSFLLNRLGIIGVCNNYLIKFQNIDNNGISKLSLLENTDPDINSQIGYVKKRSTVQTVRAKILRKEFDSNKDFLIPDLKESFSRIKNDTVEKYENEVLKFLSQINYDQIEEALELIKDVKVNTKWKDKYSFMETDFGFFWIKDFENVKERTEFLKSYHKYSEYELYKYYLSQSGIDYLNEDTSLNYDKIYELLKYDVVVAFVGGGGGKRNNEVYALIKLLEIKYKTTLGYPKKVCNSQGSYACYSDDRATEWMQYLIDNKLLKLEHNQPVSFNQKY